MSAAQCLIEEGRQKGLLEAKQKRQREVQLEGWQQAVLETEEYLLAAGFPRHLVMLGTKRYEGQIEEAYMELNRTYAGA